jgi:hypothetical protein
MSDPEETGPDPDFDIRDQLTVRGGNGAS